MFGAAAAAAVATQLLSASATCANATREARVASSTRRTMSRARRSVSSELSRPRGRSRITASAADEGSHPTPTSAGELEEPASPSSSSPCPPSPKLACPICLQPFSSSSSSSCTCRACNRTFSSSGGVWQLCLDADGANGAYREPQKSGTRLFQNDVISSVYENGWRQSFAWAGFPGAEDETRFAMEYMLGAAEGGVVLDVSCGSGLFSRRFAASGEFAHVVASDFSESMMRQARAYCEEDPKLAAAMAGGGGSTVGAEGTAGAGGNRTAVNATSTSTSTTTSTTKTTTTTTTLSFVRADVGRLPFATGSLDAVHAGAAMHCWPSPSAAVAEISRVLKPGGVFVASTFLDPTAMLGDALGGDDAVQPLSALFRESGVGTGGAFNQFWSERELRDLTTGMCGFMDFERRRSRQFIFFKVTKPVEAGAAPGAGAGRT